MTMALARHDSRWQRLWRPAARDTGLVSNRPGRSEPRRRRPAVDSGSRPRRALPPNSAVYVTAGEYLPVWSRRHGLPTEFGYWQEWLLRTHSRQTLLRALAAINQDAFRQGATGPPTRSSWAHCPPTCGETSSRCSEAGAAPPERLGSCSPGRGSCAPSA
jgi:hypothetical protein